MRVLLAFALIALLGLPLVAAAPAQEKGKCDGLKKPDTVKMDEPTKKATASALEWLARQQNTDGPWSVGGYQNNTAVTAFSLLAFMSQGQLPTKVKFGPIVQRGVRCQPA